MKSNNGKPYRSYVPIALPPSCQGKQRPPHVVFGDVVAGDKIGCDKVEGDKYVDITYLGDPDNVRNIHRLEWFVLFLCVFIVVSLISYYLAIKKKNNLMYLQVQKNIISIKILENITRIQEENVPANQRPEHYEALKHSLNALLQVQDAEIIRVLRHLERSKNPKPLDTLIAKRTSGFPFKKNIKNRTRAYQKTTNSSKFFHRHATQNPKRIAYKVDDPRHLHHVAKPYRTQSNLLSLRAALYWNEQNLRQAWQTYREALFYYPENPEAMYAVPLLSQEMN